MEPDALCAERGGGETETNHQYYKMPKTVAEITTRTLPQNCFLRSAILNLMQAVAPTHTVYYPASKLLVLCNLQVLALPGRAPLTWILESIWKSQVF